MEKDNIKTRPDKRIANGVRMVNTALKLGDQQTVIFVPLVIVVSLKTGHQLYVEQGIIRTRPDKCIANGVGEVNTALKLGDQQTVMFVLLVIVVILNTGHQYNVEKDCIRTRPDKDIANRV